MLARTHPVGDISSRFHLNPQVGDREAEVERWWTWAPGKPRPVYRREAAGRVLTDPEGNEFRVLTPRTDRR